MTIETEELTETMAASQADIQNEQESDIRQFVTFVIGDEVFGVDMAPVQEIIRVPAVVKAPLAPPTLEGLANLRGKVLPIISLRRIFGFPDQAYNDATRAVVIDLGQPLGFVVDRVASVTAVEPGKIEDVSAIRSTVDTNLLSGLLKEVGGHSMIMVLDFAKLIASEFADVGASLNAGAKASLAKMQTDEMDDDEITDELQLVSFQVAGQEYALPIEDVQEIVQVPENVIHVPRSESHVLGVMTLRNRLLPLVSLRRMFALQPAKANEQSRIVVVSLGQYSVGVVMDSVNEVLRVPKSAVDAMPTLLARDGSLSDISEICRLDGGKRLVSIISVDNMFRHSLVKEALGSVKDMQEKLEDNVAEAEEEAADDDEQVVVFRLANEEFGVPIESVQEIVRVPEQLTHVPKAPPFVEGVINLRGAVLPVIDQRRRLGLDSSERNDRQRIMVFLFEGVRTGFIVDSVTEVLKIAKATIDVAPHLSAEQALLISRVANLEKQKRLILLIEPSRLIASKDLPGLAELEG